MTLLEVRDLRKVFPIRHKGLFARKADVTAVDGVSFTLDAGETLGLVGESGCGKSTVGKLILRLIEPSGGDVRVGGVSVLGLGASAMRAQRRDVQIIFQDPYASLNPRLRAADVVAEPLANFGMPRGPEREAAVADLFRRVGLGPEHMAKFPHEFSGGQRQRLGIARAVALKPKLVVADEPVSALDVSIQAQIVNLMVDLQQDFGLAYLFISHDLAVIEHISHRVAVMYLGQIVELAPTRALFGAPRHPYTQALLAAVPSLEKRGRDSGDAITGEVPSPTNLPSGCRFHPRCPHASARCRAEAPRLVEIAPGHAVSCHLHSAAA